MSIYEDFLFLLIWFILPFIWHYLLKVAGLNLLKVTIPGIVILFFYIFQYVGLPILYFQLNEYRFASGVNDKLLMLEVASFTAYTITLMIFGYIAANKVFGNLAWSSGNGFRNMCAGGLAMRYGLFILFGICAVVLFLYLSKIGFQNIAILKVFGASGDINGSAARSAMGNAFEGKYHWYYLFFNQIMLFTAYAFFALYLNRSNLNNKVLFGAVLLVTTFSMIMAIEKAPMANFIISLFLVYVLVKKEGGMPLMQIVYITLAVLSVLIYFYINFMNSQDLISALSNVASRAFTGAMQPGYHYLEFFPEHHEYLLGRSFPNPGGILPFESYPLTKELAAWQSPDMAKRGVVGSMPAVYWGEMYANFGVAGVLVPPFFVGFILYWVNSLVFRVKPDPLVIALFVWLLMHLKDISVTSLSNYFIDIYLIVTVFFYFMIAFFVGKGVIWLRLRRRFFIKHTCS